MKSQRPPTGGSCRARFVPDLQCSASVSPVVARLALWRVPMGFASGAAAFWLARPTWRTLVAGAATALAGETLRIWAAGHVEKGREVTRSGPYSLTRHPLYAGSSVMALGLAIAAASPRVALLVCGYLAAGVGAAIRSEEATLRRRFGDEYDAYAGGRTRAAPTRRFSWARVWRNREYRAVAGLAVALALLAWKARR
jgi:protein-S-isoprenylcysteine O-methyltransferase Ste14